MDQLYKGAEGSWKCETTFVAGAFGPGSPEMKVKTDVKIKKEPGGYWYRGEYKMKKTKTNPEMGGTFMLGYDAGAKTPVNVTYDMMGGYSVEHGAAGATPEMIAFTGDGVMMGQKVKVRETMSRKDKGLEHAFEMDMGKGLQPMGSDVCKK